jgi:hypothetical protein
LLCCDPGGDFVRLDFTAFGELVEFETSKSDERAIT